MNRHVVIALTATIAIGARSVSADEHSDAVTRAVAAVRALGPDGRAALDRDIYIASRTRCHGDTTTPATACLIEAATARCTGNADCIAAADVVVTNLRSTSFFIDDVTRARLVRSSTDYHAALAAELRRRYAALAAELVLAGLPASSPIGIATGTPTSAATTTAAAIDALCRGRDRAVHACAPNDSTCIPSLPWSRCVAAVVWFVGGTP